MTRNIPRNTFFRLSICNAEIVVPDRRINGLTLYVRDYQSRLEIRNQNISRQNQIWTWLLQWRVSQVKLGLGNTHLKIKEIKNCKGLNPHEIDNLINKKEKYYRKRSGVVLNEIQGSSKRQRSWRIDHFKVTLKTFKPNSHLARDQYVKKLREVHSK